MSLFARVVFPLPLPQSFLYGVPAPLAGKVRPGTRVLVPLGRKRQKGFVVGVSADQPEPGLRTKDILEVLDAEPFWDRRFLSFTGDLAAEFYSSWGEILQAALPPSLTLKTRTVITLADAGRAAWESGGMKPRERAIAGLLAAAAKGRSPRYLERKTGLASVSSLAARMAAKGFVEIASLGARSRPLFTAGAPDRTVQLGLDFASNTASPLDPLTRAMDSRRFAAFLLTGERGVLRAAYASLVRRALGSSGKVLVLVPEITRVEQAVEGLAEGLGRRAAVFHGRLTEKQREDAWRAVRTGRASFIAGTRSALFLDPGPLSLIIVDDEHDESYVQSESPAYDARRGAWLRARSENGVVTFGSPRPSVEARFEGERRGLLVDLGGSARRPRVSVVESPRDGRLVGGALQAGIEAALGRRVPILLFLNRRGYAASLVCAKCGGTPRCRRCDVPMTFHKSEGRLVCHSCNAEDRPVCATCGGRLEVRRGPGTQALEEEVKGLFHGVPVGRFDTDAAGSAGEREAIIRDYRRGRLPILLGTQYLAHRPEAHGAGFVGILSPEAVLGFSDYRTSQRTFQDVSAMMESAAGDGAAEVMIQTVLPAHFSIQAAAAGDPLAFYSRELEFRKVMNDPPVAAMAEVTLQGRDVRTLGGHARALRALLEEFEPEVEVLGPAFASVVRVKDVSRIQVILKAAKREAIDRALRGSLPRLRSRAAVAFSYSPFFGTVPRMG